MMRVRTEEPGVRRPAAREFHDDIVEMIPVLRAYARSLCGNRDLADDLTQEALAKAWQAQQQFRPGTSLKAWLIVILRNEYYSRRRRAKTEASFSAEFGFDEEGSGPSQDASIDVADLMRAFSLLEPEQKEALILSTNGFSIEEGAEICACRPGTFKSRVSRARAQLKLLLEGNGNALPGRQARKP